MVRLVPELIAYPSPIGYDVINYYIPVTTNFASHWTQITSEFPFYVSLLHVTQSVTGLTPYSTIVIFAIIIFGVFTVSIFSIARKLLKADMRYAFFITVFVIFQMAVLRTTWDLHRDVLALAMMFFVFVLIYRESERNGTRNLNWKFILVALVLCVLVVSTARIVGSLFVVSLIIYSSLVKTRVVILCTVVAISFFTIELLMNQNNTGNIIHENIQKPGNSSSVHSTFYNPKNLMYLFVVVDGLLIPTGIFGFKQLKNGTLLKIPVLIAAAASFSWIVFPFDELLVADRWISLLGIFLSIIAAFGLYRLILRMKITWHAHQVSTSVTSTPSLSSTTITSLILGIFVIMGVLYEILPDAQEPFTLWYGMARSYTEHFVPPSMQFNSLQLSDTYKMMSAISWINKNTQPNAIIIGEKHWRGFMELYLQGHRIFRFSDDLPTLTTGLIKHGLKAPIYIIHYQDNQSKHLDVYSNLLFSIDKIS
ncbi:MAG TPA: hypothetical protein VFI73_02815 [Candidatus Nitrosopolaris sp.]|nr:hypothetical protein [Candidatus Nitrosopolaris sp.]